MSSCLLRQTLSLTRFRILTITRPQISQFHSITKARTTFCGINRTSLNFTQERNYFWVFRRRTKKEIKQIDEAPSQYELVYRSGTDHYFLSFQHLSFYAMVIICGALVWNGFDLDTDEIRKPINVHGSSDNDEEEDEEESFEDILRVGAKYDNVLYLLAAFAFMHSMLHFIISRTPARIYFHPQKQKYLVYYYGMVPNQLKTLKLRPGDLIPPKEKHLYNRIPFTDSLYRDKQTGRHFLLIDEYFRRPADLHVLLGLQKDPDSNVEFMEEDDVKVKNKRG